MEENEFDREIRERVNFESESELQAKSEVLQRLGDAGKLVGGLSHKGRLEVMEKLRELENTVKVLQSL